MLILGMEVLDDVIHQEHIEHMILVHVKVLDYIFIMVGNIRKYFFLKKNYFLKRGCFFSILAFNISAFLINLLAVFFDRVVLLLPTPVARFAIII